MTFERQSVFATGFPKKDARFSKSKNILFYSVMMILVKLSKISISNILSVGRFVWETLY